MPTALIQRQDGSIISCEIQGDADKPALLLSNSLATTRALWDDMLPALLQDFRVIRYDTRGHGQSSTTKPQASMADLARDAVAVLDHFGVKRTLMAGISLGGMTALRMAVHHAERLSGVLACNCRDFVDQAAINAWEERIAMAASKGMVALVEPTLQRWFTPEFQQAQPELMEKVAGMIRATQPVGFSACIRAIIGTTLRSEIGSITVPTRLVAGDNDGAAPASIMQAMAERIKGASCTIFADCGHLSALNQGQRLTEEIRKLARAVG